MDENKRDYWHGMLYFTIVAICMCSFITTPDGDTLLYKFIGLLGISPGIPIGKSSTLYIYMLIPFIVGICSIKRALKHWWHYGQRFSKYKAGLRYFPLFITAIIFLVSSNIEAMYYGVISCQDGLKAVVYYKTSNNFPLSYSSAGDTVIYSYDLTFQNYGDETREFQIKFINDGEFNINLQSEILIKDDCGEPKTFKLYPRQIANFKGEFTENWRYSGGSGSYSSISVVLVEDTKWHQPTPITNYPGNRH